MRINRFDIDRLGAIVVGYRTPMGAEPTSGARLLIDDRAKLVEMDGTIFKWTLVITCPAENEVRPGGALKLVDDREPHPGILLGNRLQTPRRTYFNALHTEITGDFLRFDKRRSGVNTMADIDHPYGSVGADFNTSTAPDALATKQGFIDTTRRSETVRRNRGFENGRTNLPGKQEGKRKQSGNLLDE